MADVVLILNAVDKASTEINKVTKAVTNLDKNTSGLKKAWSQLKKDVPEVGKAFDLLTNPISLVTGGLVAVGAVIKSSVSDWVEYNKQIREMTQVTGLGAEEISRIVQVGDDWGISIDTLRTSLAFMNKSGVAPSIDNLAALADEYVATTDKTEFAEKAVKLLGRGYQTLIPLLAQGGDALREQTDAVNDNLIATDKSIAASREYEVAVDELGDQWTGVKNTIGQAVVPALVDLLGALNDNIEAVQENSDVVEEYNKRFGDGKPLIDGYARAIGSTTPSVEEMTVEIVKANEAIREQGENAYRAAKKTNEMAGKMDEATGAAGLMAVGLGPQGLTGALDELGNQITNETAPSIANTLVTAFDEAKTSAKLFQDGLGLLSNSMIEQQQIALVLAIATGNFSAAEIEAKLDTLDQLEAMQQLNEALDAGTISEYDWIAAWADGKVTQEEVNTLLGLTKEGLDEIVPSAATATETIKTSGNDMALALEAPLEVAQNIKGTLDSYTDKTVNVVINTTHNDYYNTYTGNTYQNPGGKGDKTPQYASGADFIVPPGYSNDNYPIGYASSGEHVIVIPKGMTGNSTTNNNNYSMNIHTNAGASTLARDFALMKARAG